MLPEMVWLYVAVGIYLAAAVAAVVTVRRSDGWHWPMGLVALALAVHACSIVLRWARLGHGPYVNLFEILSSNVWSLHFGVLAAALAIRSMRPSLAAVLPLLSVLVLWLLTTAPVDAEAPVTYATVWLAVHVWLGKVFLACVVVAVGLGVVLVARRAGGGRVFAAMPASRALDELMYRLVFVAFLFHSLMLIAGAIWAQDAWGRYWAWDPLETWAFVTWLAIAGYLHLRATRRPGPAVGAAMVIGIFVVAFWTFFGTPFVSTAPHKGAI